MNIVLLLALFSHLIPQIIVNSQQTATTDGASPGGSAAGNGIAAGSSFPFNINIDTGIIGHKIPFLDGNNTHSGTNNVTGVFQPSGGGHISADQVNGNSVPASAVIGSNSNNQLINTNRAVGIINGLSILNDLPSVKDPQYGVIADDQFFICQALISSTALTCQQGLLSAIYVSGGSFSGSGSCTLGSFNGSGTGATANISVLAGVPGAVTLTAFGTGYSTTPTTAVLANGSATCSGTVTLNTTVPPLLTTLSINSHTKLFNISGTGGNFISTIASINSGTSITLTTPTTYAFTAHLVEIGTDDTAAWQAVAAAYVIMPVFNFPSGRSLINGSILFQNQAIWGRGSTNSIIHCVASTGICLQWENPTFIGINPQAGLRDVQVSGAGQIAPGVTDTCVQVGGGNGSTGVKIINNFIGNCSIGLEIGDNTYDVTVETNSIQGNTKNVYIAPDTNSGGEALKFIGNQIDNGGPSGTDQSACFDVETGPFALTIIGGSIVQCQLKVTAGEVYLYGVHMEDPGNHGQPLVIVTGGNLSAFGVDVSLTSGSTQPWLTASNGVTTIVDGSTLTSGAANPMITVSGSAYVTVGKLSNYLAGGGGWSTLVSGTTTGNVFIAPQNKGLNSLGTGSYTPLQGEQTLFCDAASVVVNMPTPWPGAQTILTVKNATNNACTINADSGSDLVVGTSGVSSIILYGGGTLIFQWNAQLGNWYAIGGGTNFNNITSTGASGAIQLTNGNQVNCTGTCFLTSANTMTLGTTSTSSMVMETNNVVREGISQGGPHTYATATVASATTIAVTGSVAFITGTTAIATITAPSGCTTSGTDCFLTLISDPATGPFTMTTAGNIYAVYVATIGQATTFIYHPATTKWYQVH